MKVLLVILFLAAMAALASGQDYCEGGTACPAGCVPCPNAYCCEDNCGGCWSYNSMCLKWAKKSDFSW